VTLRPVIEYLVNGDSDSSGDYQPTLLRSPIFAA
jgi:hypothetical protein